LIAEPSNMSRVLPDLYEPVLVALGHNMLLLRGYERIGERDTAFAVVQEWRCELLYKRRVEAENQDREAPV
jgi:hypothetical protein